MVLSQMSLHILLPCETFIAPLLRNFMFSGAGSFGSFEWYARWRFRISFLRNCLSHTAQTNFSKFSWTEIICLFKLYLELTEIPHCLRIKALEVEAFEVEAVRVEGGECLMLIRLFKSRFLCTYWLDHFHLWTGFRVYGLDVSNKKLWLRSVKWPSKK